MPMTKYLPCMTARRLLASVILLGAGADNGGAAESQSFRARRRLDRVRRAEGAQLRDCAFVQ
jgi:hypothetical protein